MTADERDATAPETREMSDVDEIDAAMAAAVLDPTPTLDAPSSSTSHPEPGATVSRSPTKVVASFETAEGVGARVRRSIGTPSLWNLSPFLILDYARVSPGQGFPDHAHRGMATVTYVLEGMMQHEDFLGNRGKLSVGDVQWMTAGRGIMHSEMPYFDEDNPEDAVALQLWIDLPAAKKMVKPSYKEKKASALGKATFPHGNVTVISGESHGVSGPIRPLAGCWFLDFTLQSGADTFQEIPAGWTAFIYTLEGTLMVGDSDTKIEPHNCVVLSASSAETGVRLRKNSGKADTRFVLIAGEPLDQPMILQGPFVVTSKDAAVQALRDFQNGKNGFEKAPGWQSEIGRAAGAGASRAMKGGKGKGKKGRRGDD